MNKKQSNGNKRLNGDLPIWPGKVDLQKIHRVIIKTKQKKKQPIVLFEVLVYSISTVKYYSHVSNTLAFSGLETCTQLGSLVCEDAFEVQGTSLFPHSQGPLRGRTNRRQQVKKKCVWVFFEFHF